MDSIHLPNAITLPTAFGAPGTPLQAGQVVQALVLELIESDVFRLQLPQTTVDVRSDVPLAVGSTVTLAVKGAGANARLVIYADDAPPARALPAQASRSAPQAPATSQATQTAPQIAGKHPIGEAVILSRAPMPAQPGRAAVIAQPGRTSVEAPVARDAPLLGPARPVAPIPAPAAPLTPERALGEAVRVAAPRQSGLAPLFADVERVAQAPAEAVPAPVRAAAQQIAALRVPLDQNLSAAEVKQAFVRSGVLFEPRLAAGRAEPAGQPSPSAAPAAEPPAPDLKAALLVFRQVLKTWADDTAPQRVAPPLAPAASEPADVPRAVPVRADPPNIKQPTNIATPDAPSTVPSAAPVRADVPRPLPLPAASSSLPLSDTVNIKQLANMLAGAPDEPVLPASPPLSPEQATSLAKSVATHLLAQAASDHASPVPTPNGGPPPPYRGAPLSAQQPVASAITADTPPHDSAERLLAETDGALARTTLLQAASLPDMPSQRGETPSQRWTFEVPFATPQGTAVAQFEVSRDGQAAKSDRKLPTWRARFQLDVEPMGPVHALVALAGSRTSVTLWAERPDTASRLNDNAALLSDALRAAELEPADFLFRVGAPPAVARQAAPGRFMDRAT